MHLAELIDTYGYLAVAVGTFLEGEAVLVLAGFAAHRDYLSLPGVILVALLASFLGDQLYYYLGRQHGAALLARFPALQAAAERVAPHVRRHQNLLILFIRFPYGLRVAGPIVIGMSGVSRLRFFLLNLAGAALWAPLIAGLGFVFGYALEQFLEDAHRYEELIFLGVLVVAGLFGLVRHLRRRV